MSDCLRVLIIEDSEDDALLMTSELELAGFSIVSRRVETVQAMVHAIETEQWDLILSDYRLPYFSGIEAFKIVKEHGLDVPFILVSGAIGEDTAVEAMKAGAHDYIMKGNLTRLPPAVQRELRETEIRRQSRLADKALQRSEVRFRKIYENVPVMMHSIDKDGIVRNVNQKWLSEMGYEREEVLGRNIANVMTPESSVRLTAILQKFWADGKIDNVNYRYVKKDGTIIDVLLDSAVVYDAVWGEISISTVRDITAQRRAENALKESEERYRTLIESMNEGFGIQDASGIITYANVKLCEMLQCSNQELVGRPVEEFLDRFEQNAEHLPSMINDTSYEVSWTGKKGRKVSTIMSPRPLFDFRGEFIGSCAVITDITERKRKEEELENLRRQLSLILDSAWEGILGLDQEGRHTFVNPAAARMLGYEAEELIGKKSHRIWHRIGVDDSPHSEKDCPLRDTLTTGISHAGDQVLWRKDGTGFSAELIVNPLMAGGKSVGAVATFWDITRRKQDAQELKDREHELAAIYENAPLVMVLVDDERKVRKANIPAAKLAGTSTSEMIGKRGGEALGCLHSMDAPEGCGFGPSCGQCTVRRTVLDTFKTGISHHEVEASLPFSHGGKVMESVFLLSTTKLYVREQPMVLVSILDITNRKRAEEALRQSEERFRAIFERARDCIFIKDTQFRYADLNPAAEKFLRRPVSQLIGKTAEAVFPPEQAAAITDVSKRVIDGQVVEWEHVLTINSVDFTYHTIAVPLYNSSGQVSGICGIARDISHLPKSEFPMADQIGEYPSTVMKSTLSKAALAASAESTVLLLGESGSGKDYLAKRIHKLSRRAHGPYFSVNCAAISPRLAESELFGHERGAFTGAHARKRGLLELAEGGTLLLNEIAELTPELQSKLLTFLDTKTFTRVGGEKKITINARLIAATNKDLKKEVENGTFREDLFYRLNVISIQIPPLRRRREDIPILLQEFVTMIATELQFTRIPSIGNGIVSALQQYAWPGNIREFRNVIERALIVSRGKELSLSVLELPSHDNPSTENWSFITTFGDRSLNDVTRDLKRAFVVEALKRSGGCRQDAARTLGISRYSLKHYIQTLGLADEQSGGS
ncbi:PAS domain S-box protein [Desulfomonile tiedjei]|uniref:PAS domain S-box n=1 Tax=Desulfomonile tiedjei (strain ATCC 49306 / DSM 6799 / DCB-1) TaxID=706587 RepID=I4C4X5_DESTA|nr:PAS domain S-box protein [Desulfomonile tiedjei]AFM24616.1 PAS domain S-box [Desulfomonile tiedjei DSM 6799]